MKIFSSIQKSFEINITQIWIRSFPIIKQLRGFMSTSWLGKLKYLARKYFTQIDSFSFIAFLHFNIYIVVARQLQDKINKNDSHVKSYWNPKHISFQAQTY